MDSDQQLSNFVHRVCFEVDLRLLFEEKFPVAGSSGQRTSANANLGVDRVKSPIRKLSGVIQT